MSTYNSTFRTSSPLRKVSVKRLTENKIYSVLKKKFLEKHPRCQCKGCSRRAIDIHHRNGRGGHNFLDVTTFMAICRAHHQILHDMPNQARELGYLK